MPESKLKIHCESRSGRMVRGLVAELGTADLLAARRGTKEVEGGSKRSDSHSVKYDKTVRRRFYLRNQYAIRSRASNGQMVLT